MESVPISSCFYITNSKEQMNSYDEAIQKLKEDEASNPQNIATDEKEISYYQQLEDNLKQEEALAAAFRASDNDPTISKQIKICLGRQETLTQLVGLTSYIDGLKEDSQKNPQDAVENAKKIANAQQQEQCIQQFEKAWEAYQQTGSQSDADKVNQLIQELQELRTENPSAPYSNNLIWEDFQYIVDKPTVLEFDGQKYLVAP